MTSVSNFIESNVNYNNFYTLKEKIANGLVPTAYAVAGISLIVIGVTAGLAIGGATVFGCGAIFVALTPLSAALAPFAPLIALAMIVTFVAGMALCIATLLALPFFGDVLIARAVNGRFPKFD